MSAPTIADVAVGDTLPSLQVTLRRSDLVRYAGASGDFNVIHWNDRVATEVGLPGVIAHGMLTMAQAVRVVTAWVGDPSKVVSYGVRFTRPVPVPDDDTGALLSFGGTVREIDGDEVALDLDARLDDETVLARARATVRLG